MRPLIFDETALIALFASHEHVGSAWYDAAERGISVGFPAAAVFAANLELKASDNAWEALLLFQNVTLLPLGSNVLDASRLSRNLVIAHVSLEAEQMGGIVLTSRPDAYPPLVHTVDFGT